MRQKLRRDWILLGVAFLAVAQAMVVTRMYGSRPTVDDRWFTTGDTLAFLHAPNSPSGPTPLDREAPTILLVFNSECPHCLEVAPLWRDWTRTSPARARVVALSSEAQAEAEAFVSAQGWDAMVWTVDATDSGSPNHTLTSRAPWVLVLDPEGVILAEGHGEDIDEVVSILISGPRSTP